ncbi:hypothetical protein [Mesorhizobium sp. ANAO-SY3R2]|uniref:hypothetical protein n=1 Tax=Mesorhizobium sp. ANAO-SY3R2 TaxID=3166644 RepID=UPI00366D1EB5
MLAYAAARRDFFPGEALTFDRAYRLAHLPLVAPDHPDVIESEEGKDYFSGRYAATRYSLTLPIDAGELGRSGEFQAFEQELRRLSFSAKINWEIGRERAEKLHATVIGGLSEADIEPCARAAAAALAPFGALSIRLGGPFLGTMNTGRIYLPVYPECHEGKDILGLVQAACGTRQSRFYGVGYYHFSAPLTVAETEELAGLIERWRESTLATLAIGSLAIQATNDDLALSGRIVTSIPVGGGPEARPA